MKGETVFIAGAGLMGTDISLLFANADYDVILFDISRDALVKARKRHLDGIGHLREAGILHNENAFEHIKYTLELSKSSKADFVFEAIVEDLYIKRRFFKDIEKYVSRDTVFASNTSSFTISEIGTELEDPRRLGGMHFSNPPILMRLIEVSGGEETVDDTLDIILEKSQELDKKPIILDRECRGFVLNRLLYVAFVDALIRLEAGVRPEDLDSGVKNLGVPFGVVEGMDLIGLDTVKRILDNLTEVYGNRYTYPKHLLEEKIARGELGKKRGFGFYKWVDDKAVIPEGEPLDPTRVVAVVINEAYRIHDEGIADEQKISDIYKYGVNAPAGIFDVAQLFGEEYLNELLSSLYDKTGHLVYKPYKL